MGPALDRRDRLMAPTDERSSTCRLRCQETLDLLRGDAVEVTGAAYAGGSLVAAVLAVAGGTAIGRML